MIWPMNPVALPPLSEGQWTSSVFPLSDSARQYMEMAEEIERLRKRVAELEGHPYPCPICAEIARQTGGELIVREAE